MPPAANTFTVTVADAHAHSVQQSGVPGANKVDACLSVMQNASDELTLSNWSQLVAADTWTITITQP